MFGSESNDYSVTLMIKERLIEMNNIENIVDSGIHASKHVSVICVSVITGLSLIS